MKGRPKDPKRARRRTGHRRKPDEAPALRAVPSPIAERTLPPPEHLSDDAKEAWVQITTAIEAGGLPMRNLDAWTLEALVVQVTRMRQAGAVVDQYGVLHRKGNDDVIASPFLKAEREAASMLLRLAEQSGLTLAARMRLGLMQLQAKTLTEALSEDLESGQ
ncbi:MAG: phage terminase small subunit P27 family [Actinomycetota bacterium]